MIPTLAQVSRPLSGTPFFSVCIPEYNRTSFLIEACRSLEQQTFRDFEVCISDDNSPHNRHHELVAYLQESNLAFRYHRRTTNGRYDVNLRTAMDLATGRYFFLLANDDVLTRPDVLQRLHDLVVSTPNTHVVLTNFEDFSTGQVTDRVPGSGNRGGGPSVAAAAYRRFSFVSGIVLDGARARAERTERWDGSEMYQMYIGTRLIAAGGGLVEDHLSTIRKDVQIAGELVDNYARRPKAAVRGIPIQPIPVSHVAKLVVDALAPYDAAQRTPVLLRVVTQYFGFLLPYWLLEYRRVQTWRYAAGVARAMAPHRALAGVTVPMSVRAASWGLFLAATTVGLTIPARLTSWIYRPARRLARLVGEWRPSTT